MNKLSKEREAPWNPALYDSKHSFVWQYGAEVVSLLAPQPGERILDIGCGTGHLTAKIAESEARVLGVDVSQEMVAAARKNYPHLEFLQSDARDLRLDCEFDAVFSNAAIHWILEPARVIAILWNALRPGGRFVGEFGGKGNTLRLQGGFKQALQDLGMQVPGELNPWYFPSPGAYATLLEEAGFEVRYMILFDRPTTQAGGEAGLRNWITAFYPDLLSKLPPGMAEPFMQRLEEILRAELFREGQWTFDYKRLRFAAWK
jgi:trans-aconitate methyltransferase